MIKTSKLLAETSNELLEAHDLRDWNRLEEVLLQHFQLLGVDNDKALIAAGYAIQAFKEDKDIIDDLSYGKIKIDELKTNNLIVGKKVLPKIASKMYLSHSKTLEALGEPSDSAYNHTKWWLQYHIGKRGGIVPKLSMVWHLYEQQRKKYGMKVAIKTTPNLIKIAKAHKSKDKKKQTEELMKYWDKILSSGSKSVMY